MTPARGRPERGGPRHYHRWTPAEDKVLLMYWPDVTWRVLRAKLGGRKRLAIWRRVGVLGLPRGVPQGFVSVADAARSQLVDRAWLAAFCEAKGVPLRRVLGRTRRHVRPRRYVDLELVREKLAPYFAHRDRPDVESISAAARARGVHHCTLTAWLLKAGLFVRARQGLAATIPTADIDRVVAHHRGRTLKDVAQLIGLSVGGTRFWLQKAGVYPPGRGVRHFAVAAIRATLALRKKSTRLGRALPTPRLGAPTRRKAA